MGIGYYGYCANRNSPCRECANRYPGCGAECTAYKVWKTENQECKAQISEAKRSANMIIPHKYKTDKHGNCKRVWNSK